MRGWESEGRGEWGEERVRGGESGGRREWGRGE